MNLENYILFITVATIYIASPGPAVFVSINYGINYGVKKTFFLLLGNSTGLGILAFISAIGLGFILINNPDYSKIVKIIGAIFLIYLGFKMIKNAGKNNIHINCISENKSIIKLYLEGLALSLTNPKPIIFFLSIYPQFNSNGNIYMNFFILGVTFVIISLSILLTYGFLSNKILKSFLLKKKRLKIFNIFSGITLILISVSLLFF